MSACTCLPCQRHVNRFTRLSPEQVFSMFEAAEAASRAKVDRDERARAALDDAWRAVNGSPEWEAAMEHWLAVDMERDTAPVAAYLAPVKRWGGGPAILDNWYWDRNSL